MELTTLYKEVHWCLHAATCCQPASFDHRYAITLTVLRNSVRKGIYFDTAQPHHSVRVIEGGAGRQDLLLVSGEDHDQGIKPSEFADYYGRYCSSCARPDWNCIIWSSQRPRSCCEPRTGRLMLLCLRLVVLKSPSPVLSPGRRLLGKSQLAAHVDSFGWHMGKTRESTSPCCDLYSSVAGCRRLFITTISDCNA